MSERDKSLGSEETGDKSEDFATLLEASSMKALELKVGDRVRAKIVHIGKEDVFCEVSPTQEAVIARSELEEGEGRAQIRPGEVIEAFVVSLRHGIVLSKRLGREAASVEVLMQAAHSELPVEGLVTGVNKGGLEVSVGGVRAFCPIGQADIAFVETPQVFVGKTFQFVVKEVRDNGRSVVISRRALLEAERAARAKELLAQLEVGQHVTGTVTRLMEFGAFVDLGGVEGLIPVSELSYTRVTSPRDVVREGEILSLQVLRYEPDPKRPEKPRITLSLKATLPEPFAAHEHELQEGTSFQGRVVRIEKFGAFVELFPGLEGLVHISELSHKRVRHPSDVVKVGQEVTVRVLGVSPEDKRISLSLKEAPVDEGSKDALAPGALVDGTVERVERFGVFVRLTSGATALLPAAESGTPAGSDLAKAFPVGSQHALVVLAVDERNRVKVSRRAREAAEERAVLDDYQRSQSGEKGFGTLGDLLRSQMKK
jgi:small subunit ribosomal protein S1